MCVQSVCPTYDDCAEAVSKKTSSVWAPESLQKQGQNQRMVFQPSPVSNPGSCFVRSFVVCRFKLGPSRTARSNDADEAAGLDTTSGVVSCESFFFLKILLNLGAEKMPRSPPRHYNLHPRSLTRRPLKRNEGMMMKWGSFWICIE